MHVRTQVGTRVEETANQFALIQKAVREIIPPKDLDVMADNIGLSISSINLTYNNTGLVGSQDGDIQIALKEGHRPTAEYVKKLREQLPRRFPGLTFTFPPADIVSQILNFGSPAPIDLQIRGSNLTANFDYANSLLTKIRAIPGIADVRIQQARTSPYFDVDLDRTRAQELGITTRDVTSSPRRQSRRQQPGRADVLAEPAERRVVSDRDPVAAIPPGFAERLGEPADRRCRRHVAGARRRCQFHAYHRQCDRQPVRHPAADPDQCRHARARPRLDRDRRGVA